MNFLRFIYFFPNNEFKEVQKDRIREGLRLKGVSWDQVALLLVSPYLLMPGVVSYPVQGDALPHVELHDVPISPALQPGKIALDHSTTLWYVTPPCAIRIHGEGMFCPIIQVISEDVDQELLITSLQLDVVPLVTTL